MSPTEANRAHAFAITESIVQINSEGPFAISYVSATDDPRNAKEFNSASVTAQSKAEPECYVDSGTRCFDLAEAPHFVDVSTLHLAAVSTQVASN